MAILKTIRNILPEVIWNMGAAAKHELVKHRYLKGKRKYNPAETNKAKRRREEENFFENYCKGKGLDIGFGGDLIVPNAQGFDFEHGDAHFLEGIENESFDFVYSSHTLEHMVDPEAAIKNWFRVVKKGGYLIVFIPHRDLYEKKKTLPSKFNPTHKQFFLIDKDELPDTIGIVPFVKRTLNDAEIIYAKECREGYDRISDDVQSTGEYSIEIVIKKN
ncbi:MAG: class I SAM-dependent methyltransferase [Ignavibacteriae bacterium]|jgi:SAM-dependent methyltransferase|nr:class I SAM-dependent methyltransferase [Ignavibacteriota bacterium]